jgi:hypothetical protein
MHLWGQAQHRVTPATGLSNAGELPTQLKPYLKPYQINSILVKVERSAVLETRFSKGMNTVDHLGEKLPP